MARMDLSIHLKDHGIHLEFDLLDCGSYVVRLKQDSEIAPMVVLFFDPSALAVIGKEFESIGKRIEREVERREL